MSDDSCKLLHNMYKKFCSKKLEAHCGVFCKTEGKQIFSAKSFVYFDFMCFHFLPEGQTIIVVHESSNLAS